MIQSEKIDQERYHKQINKAKKNSSNHLHAMVLFFNTTKIFCSWTYSVPCLWCDMKNKKKNQKRSWKTYIQDATLEGFGCVKELHSIVLLHGTQCCFLSITWIDWWNYFKANMKECLVKLQRFNHTRVLLSFKPSAINSAPRSPMIFAVDNPIITVIRHVHRLCLLQSVFLPAKLSSCKVEFTFKTCPIALAPAVRTLFPVHLLSHLSSSLKNRSF